MPRDMQVIATDGLQVGQDKAATISGVTRLSQQFVIELLTEIGSMHYTRHRGSHFLPRLRQKQLTELSVTAAFSAASREIIRNLRKDEGKLNRLDERIRRVKLNSMRIEEDHISFNIAVYARDGSVAVIDTPPVQL